MSTMTTTTTATTTFATSAIRDEAIAAFHEHLVREFHMPLHLALARVNSELAANPLTCNMQLQVCPSDFEIPPVDHAAPQTYFRRAGFTLVELLVVIGIIAVLMSILMPVMGRARKAAREVACMSNVRQLSHAMMSYSDTYRGFTMPIVFTPGEYWHHKLAIQLGDRQYPQDPNNSNRLMYRLMRCPETDEAEPTGWGSAYTRWKYGDGSGSYGLNLWLLPNGFYANQFPPSKSFAKLSSVRKSSDVPMLLDSIWVGGWPDNNDFVFPNIQTGWGQHQNGYFMGRFCIDRHRKAVNVGFVDGSVRRVPLADLWRLNWHRQSAPKDIIPAWK